MHSVQEVFASYCNVNVDLAENTLAHTQRCLRLFCEFLAARSRSPTVREISRDDVADWRAWMIVEKDPEGRPRFKPSTVNSYLKGAAPLFAWCMQRKDKLIDENPFCRVKYLAEDIPVYEYTKEEVHALLEAADVRWKGMIVLACASGLSRGECLNLTWPDLDCDTHSWGGADPESAGAHNSFAIGSCTDRDVAWGHGRPGGRPTPRHSTASRKGESAAAFFAQSRPGGIQERSCPDLAAGTTDNTHRAAKAAHRGISSTRPSCRFYSYHPLYRRERTRLWPRKPITSKSTGSRRPERRGCSVSCSRRTNSWRRDRKSPTRCG